MSLFNRNDDMLDRAIAEVNGEPIDPAAVDQAASRVWERLSQGVPANQVATPMAATAAGIAAATAAPEGSLRGCEDFQSLIPAYLRCELSPARAMLVEDHTRTCVPCRRALREAREGKTEAVRPVRSAASLRRNRLVWQSLAALLVLGVGIGLLVFMQEMFAGGSNMARVESVEGFLFQVDGASLRPVSAGDSIDEGDEIRTAKGSTAMVRMADGSLIEMSERAAMSLDAGRKGNTIQLDGGRVIVEAAKQRQRHLFVASQDAVVSVTGTIFSVNAGLKGTRVSVVEGEVRVKQARRDDILHPGDQVATHASVAAVPIAREVAWSRNSAKYQELLAELTALGKEIDAQVERPGLRYSSRLLGLAPAGTKAWVALPNLANNLNETYRLLDQKVQSNGTVRQWWGEVLGTPEKDAKFREALQKIGDLGRNLGEEVAVAVSGDDDDAEPLILAEVTNEAAFRAVLEQEAAQLQGKHGKTVLQIVDDPAGLPAGDSDVLYAWVGNGLFAASPSGAQLAQVAALAGAGGGNGPFAATPFYARINQEYQEGAGWLFAADLAGFIAADDAQDAGVSREAEQNATAERLGVRDLQHFILNRQEVDGRADTRAALTFNQQRRGIASWLAAPAAMGTLSFISPDANLAAAFIVKQPVSLLDDLIQASPELAAELDKIRTEHGFDVREDLAAPLGGEVALAVDGPLLPTPSWKLIAEVYDPARMQQTLEKMVRHLDSELRGEGKPGVALREDQSGGRTFYAIESPALKMSVHYLFEDGYFVAAASRALLDRALQNRESGVTLATHPKFRDLLGQDGQVSVSAFYYQNVEELAKSAAGFVPEGPQGEKEVAALKNLLIGQGPLLAYAYAEEDRILFASSNQSPLGLNLQTLAGFGGILGMMDHAHDAQERAQEEAR